MPNEKLIAQVDAALKNPLTRDFLHALAASEGGEYNLQFGGARFDDMSRHPGRVASYVDRHGRRISSTAAGRYQFLQGTYKDVAGQLGLADFSPASQDKAAVALIIRAGALDDVLSGNIAGAVAKLGSTWTSLPGSRLGLQHHAVRTPEFFVGAYNAARKARGEQPAAVTWNGQIYDNIGSDGHANGAPVRMGVPGPGGLAGQIFARYASGAYGQNGGVPFQMGMGGHLAVDADPMLTPDVQQQLRNRLYGGELGYGGKYGMSFVDGSLRPTIRQALPDGTDVNLIEFPDNVYIDAATGLRRNQDGSEYVMPSPPPANELPAADSGSVIPAGQSVAESSPAPIQEQVSAQDYLMSATAPAVDDPLKVNVYNDPIGQMIASYLRRI